MWRPWNDGAEDCDRFRWYEALIPWSGNKISMIYEIKSSVLCGIFVAADGLFRERGVLEWQMGCDCGSI